MTKKSMVLLRVMSRAAGIFLCLGMIVLLVNAAHAQSFWEKRQKRIEEMRKKDLKKPPQDKMIVTPETKPVPEEEIQEPIPAEEFTLPPLEMFEPEETLGLKEVPRIIGPDDYIDPEDIKISEEYGTIKEVHNEGKNSKLVIHVQDAHVNYDAQISIAHIVEELLLQYGVNIIGVEGGLEEHAGVTRFSTSGSREMRIKVARRLLREGKFDGVKYIDGLSFYPLIVKGIEDVELYYESDDLQLEIMDSRDAPKKKIAEILLMNKNLKAGIFNKELLGFDEKKKQYNEEKITLTEYSLFLENKAKNIKIKKKASNFAKLLQTIKLEQEIDFPGVDDERTKLIDELTKGADKKKSDELVQKSLDFRQGKINAVDYYAYLNDQYASDLAASYLNLDKYIRYITIHRSIDTHMLFSEIDTLEWDIRKQYYENGNQKKLDAISRNLTILNGLFNLALTPDEYNYYRENQEEIRNVKAWARQLNKMSAQLNLQKRIDVNVQKITDRISLLDRFYANTLARDEGFVRKTNEIFKKYNRHVVIVVTGGFHTPNLISLFRKHKLSYVVIAPKIENPTPEGLYDRVIREEIEARKNK